MGCCKLCVRVCSVLSIIRAVAFQVCAVGVILRVLYSISSIILVCSSILPWCPLGELGRRIAIESSAAFLFLDHPLRLGS